ncbi:MAG: hypothetical protein ABH834_01900 [Candidatus Altiarchaeota archaeon]
MQKIVQPVNLDSVLKFDCKLGPALSGEFRRHATYLSTAGPGVEERMMQSLSMPDEAEAAIRFGEKLSAGEMRGEYRNRILPFLLNAGEGTRERLHQAWAKP